MSQNTQLISLLAGVVVPLLVGLLTKLHAAGGVKAVLNAALSALGADLALVIPGHFVLKSFLITWASTWVISIATHYGLYVPTGVSQAVQSSTANVGIG